ncbi:MAG: alpha/beta fold hydrolase [Flavobacteriaceae bacterium]
MAGLLSGTIFLQWQKPQPLAKHLSEFQKKGISPIEKYFKGAGGQIYSWYTKKKERPTLLLIHGSPGDWTAWKKLLLNSSIAHDYQIVVFDRPTFGLSTVQANSLAEQSRALQPLMELFCHPCTLVGHSYGSALALRLAIDYPNHIEHLLSIAGTVAAPYQEARWYNRWGATKLGQLLMSRNFLQSNTEMLLLANDLQKVEAPFQKFDGQSIFIQGGADFLVSDQTADYIRQIWPKAKIHEYPNKNHFLIWTDIALVVETLKTLFSEN